jgi:hypothetical protein
MRKKSIGRGGFIMNDRRKKFWVRLVVGLMLAAFVLPSIIMLFSR